MKPLISAHIITHRPIDETMASIADLIDEAVISCTTRGAKRAVQENIKANAWRFPVQFPMVGWQGDFSATRNDNLERLSGEWVLHIDSDEKLVYEDGVDAAKVRAFLQQTTEDAFYVPFWNWMNKDKTSCSKGRLIRIFRREKAHFEQPVQNVLVGFDRAIVLEGIRIEHDGYDSAEKLMEKARERMPIYDEALEKDPESWHLWYYYAKNLFFARDIGKCIEASRKAIDLLRERGLIGEGTPYVDVYRVLAWALLSMGNFNGASQALLDALCLCPRYSDAYHELYIVHGLLADHYRKCWGAELKFREETGEIPAYELVHFGEVER